MLVIMNQSDLTLLNTVKIKILFLFQTDGSGFSFQFEGSRL